MPELKISEDDIITDRNREWLNMWDDYYPEEWQDAVEFDRGIRKLGMIDLTDSHYDLLTAVRDRERDGVNRELVHNDCWYDLEELDLIVLVPMGEWKFKLYAPTFLGHVALAAWEARQCPST